MILSRRLRSSLVIIVELIVIAYLLFVFLSSGRLDYSEKLLDFNSLTKQIPYKNDIIKSYFEMGTPKSEMDSRAKKILSDMDYSRREMDRIKAADKLELENFEKNRKSQQEKEEEEKQLQEKQDKLNKERKRKERKRKNTANKQKLELYKDETTIKLDPAQYPNVDFENANAHYDITNGFKPFQDLLGKFIDILVANRQSFLHPARLQLKDGKPIIWVVHTWEHVYDITEETLMSFLDFDDNFIDDLQDKHFNVVKTIPDTPPINFYQGKGYVIVGGGKYSWFTLLSIKNLRAMGSKLPVEVFIPNDDEFEDEYCNVILPTLNAKCIQLSKVFGKSIYDKINTHISGYQYKSFALLASSFKDVFLLDSDSFPVANPDPVFDSALYKNFKMLTWPDFWRRTVSPYFYEVAGMDIGTLKSRNINDFYTPLKYFAPDSNDPNYDPYSQISFHDRKGTLPDWSSESGQLLIDKNEHFNTLLLSLYYNFDGPYGYHPLLSQGGAGEGDKETFCAAATYYEKPFYQLYKAPDRLFGYYDREKGMTWEHSTIAQHDPLTDFEILVKNVHRVLKQIQNDPTNFQYDYLYTYRFPWNPENVKPMFYHVHDPKFDPVKIISENYHLDQHGQQVRNMGTDLKRAGYDLELRVWYFMNELLCSKDKKVNMDYFKDEERSAKLEGYCAKDFIERIKYLEESGKELLLADKSDKPKEQPEDFIPGVDELTSEIGSLQLSIEEYTAAEAYIFKKAGLDGPFYHKYGKEINDKKSAKQKAFDERARLEKQGTKQPAPQAQQPDDNTPISEIESTPQDVKVVASENIMDESAAVEAAVEAVEPIKAPANANAHANANPPANPLADSPFAADAPAAANPNAKANPPAANVAIQ